MSEFIFNNEPLIRLGIFASVFALMAVWELIAPRRHNKIGRMGRWPSNIAVVIVDTLAVRLLFPVSAVALALFVEEHEWGALQYWSIPTWLAIPIAVIILDFVIYLQHVLFHAVPVLWRLHRMHHADLEFDVTTGTRFHPIEIILSMIIKLSVITALGAPAIAVLIFEVLLNATAMFNHSNIKIPIGIDRVLRWIIVTPDMHRVHHSIIAHETNSNFGFNLPWWDRLFGTYRNQPEAGHDEMVIGVEQIRDPVEQRLDYMITQPFRHQQEQYSLKEREAEK